MEESTISTNVHIDFNKKNNANKPRPTTPRPRSAVPARRPRPVEAPSYEDVVIKGELPVKIGFLGGLEQVGENMMFLEYKDDIIIIDAGLVFPGGDMY